MDNEEKRGCDRGYTLMYVTLFDGKRFLKEFVYDASPGGIMIKTCEHWETGTLLGMVIHAHVPIRAKGKVAWVRKDGDNYKIGIEFSKIDADSTLSWVDLLKHS